MGYRTNAGRSVASAALGSAEAVDPGAGRDADRLPGRGDLRPVEQREVLADREQRVDVPGGPRLATERLDQLGAQHVTALALEVTAEELPLPLELQVGLDPTGPRDRLRVGPPDHRRLARAVRGAEDARAPPVGAQVGQRPNPVAEPARRADVGDAVAGRHDVDPGLGLDAHPP